MWSVNAWLDQRGGDWLAMGVGSFAVAIALLGYGAWFLKKLRNMSSQ
jgi:flagellar biogenesis protein FliO